MTTRRAAAARRPLVRRRLAGILLFGIVVQAAVQPPVLLARPSVSAPAAVVFGLLPPVAVNDSATAVHGQLRTIAAPGVLANDLQIGGGYTAILVTNAANGTLTLDPDGGYRYRSNATFVGTDTFRYKVDGGLLGLSNIATVTITVTNTTPVARPDAYTATAGVERSIAAPGILADDTDADGDSLTASLVSGPPNGTVSVSANGSFRYTADAGFSGVDTFRYRVTDGIAWSGTVDVDMTVSAPTPAPTAPPTPTPTPTPTPAPTGAATATPGPTATGGGTPTPSGSAGPGGSASPSDQPAGSGGPGGSGGPSASPGSSGAPTADPSAPAGGAGSGGTGSGSTSSGGSGTGGPGTGGTEPIPGGFIGPFDIGSGVRGGPIAVDLDASFATFDGFEWAIPAAALSVPLLLVILAILGQALVGLAWVPLTRRWLGGDRQRRRPHVAIG